MDAPVVTSLANPSYDRAQHLREATRVGDCSEALLPWIVRAEGDVAA